MDIVSWSGVVPGVHRPVDKVVCRSQDDGLAGIARSRAIPETQHIFDRSTRPTMGSYTVFIASGGQHVTVLSLFTEVHLVIEA